MDILLQTKVSIPCF